MSAETAASVATSLPESEAVPLIGGVDTSIAELEKLSLGSPGPGVGDVTEEPRLEMPKLEGNTRVRPLRLVDLPEDVLREIIKEVTHTNDLTNLCLTCRCLHHLAVPQIYSRFDIVWPDTATTGDRIGVDALTHGLATLTNTTRRGNNYARWVKKFSLGNGPKEWVNEYNINKEGGKMLGTLVNLALTRMESLETFSWDMPTGILRDVFMTLHDLNGTLKNVHVRFHDNKDTQVPTSQDPSRRVETPTFKGFKGLRSLSVLDIDERQYLEEMSYAIEASVHTLRELRVGIAENTASLRRWIRDWDEFENGAGQTASFGGVMGIAFGRINTLKNSSEVITRPTEEQVSSVYYGSPAVATAEPVPMTSTAPATVSSNPTDQSTGVNGVTEPVTPGPEPLGTDGATPEVTEAPADDETVTDDTLSEHSDDENAGTITPAELPDTALNPQELAASVESELPNGEPAQPPAAAAPKELVVRQKVIKTRTYESMKPPAQLKLETLALERVPLSVSTLISCRVIDWAVLQNITILNCFHHDRLWKVLRRKFMPVPIPAPGSVFGRRPVPKDSDYRLRFKKLHTDCVTPMLISFIRETLPPNSLETLFLQEKGAPSVVPMEHIFAAVKRHKKSLKKLLIDSENEEMEVLNYKWAFTREQLLLLSSGRMKNLKELSLSLDYRDWHFFLTQLPRMSQLRSLHVAHIRESQHHPACPPRELANQILNTVILRPEIELCYVGILNKCFEILEGPSDDMEPLEPHQTHVTFSTSAATGVAVEDSEDEDDEDGDDVGDSDSFTDLGADTESVASADDEAGRVGEGGIRLREILFYDDKVEIFRARNARL